MANDGFNYPSRYRAAYILTLLVFACLIAYIDQQIFALTVTPIKLTFGISDTRVGVLQGAALNFSMALAGLPMGYVIDRRNRMRFLAVTITIWSGFTVLSALSVTFWQLFACRIGVGIGEAGLYPVAYSIIADLYPPRARTGASLVFFGSILVSASAATAAGGGLISAIELISASLPESLSRLTDWRLVFIAAALPGFLLALITLASREPIRQIARDWGPGKTDSATLLAFLRRHWLAVSSLCICPNLTRAAFLGLFFWLPTILARGYEMPAARAGEWLGLTVGVGTVSGVLLAIALERLGRNRFGTQSPLYVLKVGMAATAICVPILFFVKSAAHLLEGWILLCACTYIASSIVPTILMTVIPNQLRGQVYAISGLCSSVFAAAWPPLVGVLSDRIFTSSAGLLYACLAVGLPCGLIAIILIAGLKGSFSRMTDGCVQDLENPIASAPIELNGPSDRALCR